MISHLTRAAAAKWTLGFQGVAGVFALGAVTLASVGLPGRAEPQTAPPGVPPGAPTGSAAAPTGNATEPGAPIDVLGLAQRLAMVENAPALPVVEQPPVENGQPEPTADPTPQPFATRVRYLGLIRMGDANAAFVNIDNRQRIVREGDEISPPEQRPELGPLQVERIRDDFVVIAHESGRAIVRRGERSGPSITMVSGESVDRVAEEQPVEQPVETNRFGRRRPGNNEVRTLQTAAPYMPPNTAFGNYADPANRPVRRRNQERPEDER